MSSRGRGLDCAFHRAQYLENSGEVERLLHEGHSALSSSLDGPSAKVPDQGGLVVSIVPREAVADPALYIPISYAGRERLGKLKRTFFDEMDSYLTDAAEQPPHPVGLSF